MADDTARENGKGDKATPTTPRPSFDEALRKALNTPPLTNKQVKEQAAKERGREQK